MADLSAFMAAIRQVESEGDYTVTNSIGASGAYQFMQSTWDQWARAAGYTQYVGKPAADAPPAVQDAVALAAMTSYYDQYGGNLTDVAEAWYGGPGGVGRPDTAGYAQRVMSAMDQSNLAGNLQGGGDASSASADWNTLWSFASGAEGTPYVYGGDSSSGYDCSGFTSSAYQRLGINIGRTTTQQLQSGQVVGQDGNWQQDISELQPGDLIFYGAQGASGPNAHVVMYIGNGRVIQAGGQNVNITNLFQSASPTEPFLGIRRYTTFVNAPAGSLDPNGVTSMGPPGNTSAPSMMADTSGGATGSPPSMADMPALKQYIEQNFGSDAWLLSIPDVATILEEAVAQGLDATQIQARIQQTVWWRTTSQAVKNYEEGLANNPAEYSFTTAGSQASQTLAQIMATAATAGVTLNPQQAQSLATDAMKFGWTATQIQAAIGAQATVANAAPVDQQLKAMAMQYYMPISPQALQTWVTNIAGGTQTIQQFQAQMAQDAAQKWTGYAPQLQSGSTMQQLTDSLRTEAAKTMEVDPTQIDFLNNPTYSKILDYVPPGSPNGVHRVMTMSEMDQYLKSQPAWGYTQQGRDQDSTLAETIAQTFGRFAG